MSDWRIPGGLLEIRKMSAERSGVEKDEGIPSAHPGGGRKYGG